jgi:hypothetical protein
MTDQLAMFGATAPPPVRASIVARLDILTDEQIAVLVEWLDGQIIARLDWLETHSGKARWSEQDIAAKREGLANLRMLRRLLGGSDAESSSS